MVLNGDVSLQQLDALDGVTVTAVGAEDKYRDPSLRRHAGGEDRIIRYQDNQNAVVQFRLGDGVLHRV